MADAGPIVSVQSNQDQGPVQPGEVQGPVQWDQVEGPVQADQVEGRVQSTVQSTVRSSPTATRSRMDVARTAGTALVNWWRAVSIEALCVAVLWFAGLALIRVPWAPAWALIAGVMTFIPHLGGVLSLIGPVFSILVSGHDMERLAWVLGLYAVIVAVDQLGLQPWLMKRTARVPVWASILIPIVLGIVIPFWGVLLAPPLLAVVYAFRKPKSV